MLTDRQRVELILPAYFMLDVVDHGVNDKAHEDAQKATMLLHEAIHEPLSDLVDKDINKLIRRVARVHNEVLKPYRMQNARVDKVGLIGFYLLKTITDQDYLVLHPESAMQKALDLVLPALEPSAQIDALDKSAQKQARNVLQMLQAQGFYRGVTLQ